MNRFKEHSNCLWTRERIDTFLDGELGGDELATLQSHVDVCAECRRELARARRVLHELHELPDLYCPDEVVETSMAGLEETPHRAVRGLLRRWFGGALRPALASAFVVLVAASAFYVANRVRQPALSPEEVASAEAELKWTLAYIGDVGRRAGMIAAGEAFEAGMVVPVQRAVRSAFEPASRAVQQPPTNEQSPKNPRGGGSA
ncbi:MAG: anti-sigma factor family protein [Candidatus Krumholzibacteriia bacterium]